MSAEDNRNHAPSGRHDAPATSGGVYARPNAPRQGANGNAAPAAGFVPAGGRMPAAPGAHGAHHASSDEVVRVRKKRKRHRKALKVVLGIVIALVVAVGGVAAYGAWYVNSLASNMALDGEQQSELDSVLAPVEETTQEQQPFYLLLVGSDNWETYGERSDALVLVRIDPADYQVTLVSVPRDTPYILNGQKVKINQAFAEQGPAGAVQAVQDLTGVSISYYAEIEFAGLAEFVDSMGGIYVDVPYTIDYEVYTHDQDPVHIEAGLQHLDGE